MSKIRGVRFWRNAVQLTAAITLVLVGLATADRQRAHAQAVETAGPIEAILRSGEGVSPQDLGALKQFYEARKYRPAWFDGDNLNADGATAIAAMAASSDDGLDPANYELVNLRKPLGEREPDMIARRDLFLTIQVLHYCADVRNGRDELLHLDPDVDLPRDDINQAPALSHALLERKLPEFLQAQPPQSATYAALKAALENYRVVAEKGDWGELPPTSKFEAKDVDAETLAFLQRRLKLEDPAFASNPSPTVSDINSAIRRFQISNGLDGDGVVGRATLAALNVSAATRVAQIGANMERLRWLPHTPEKSYVTVNVPNATLVVVGNGVELLSSRVIVGRPNDRTPIFRAMITEVVANPPWVVPKTIARAEILPKLRKNPSYLVDHQMIMANGQIRQLPGPTNALGFLKLNVSDRFAVYLHDTPSRTLFARNERFLSHGCIRVQQIVPLASYALTGDVTGGAERLAAAIATGQTVRLTLKAPIPLYVNYFTAFLSADGSLQFRPDIYGRDARLIAAMRGRSFAQATSSTGVCRRPA